MKEHEEIIKNLQKSNKIYAKENKNLINKFIKDQKPRIALITCSDSRVIPEKIFKKSIGEIFTIRIAGNLVIDPTVLSSLEYAVDHLKVQVLIILGHTNCGAIKLTENSPNTNTILTTEIRKSFPLNNNHTIANTSHQLKQLLKKSKTIKNAVEKNQLKIVGAIYNIETGLVDFL